MKFGYARVSTRSQKHDLQVDVSSGAKAERKGLDQLLSKLREGDTVVVWKLDRIARSLSHLAKLVEEFEQRGIHFKSVQENFIDTTSSHGRFVFNIFASVAQLERDIIIERTRAGLESSRRRGVKLGRQPGLSKQAQHRAMLAERYYRENDLSVGGDHETGGHRLQEDTVQISGAPGTEDLQGVRGDLLGHGTGA